MRQRLFLIIFAILPSLVFAEESQLDNVENSAQEIWQTTKEKTSDIATSVADKTREWGGQASENTQEAGNAVWDKVKELGNAAAVEARKGASKIRELAGQEEKCDTVTSSVCKDE